MADLYLANGRLHTQDRLYLPATALAVREGRIMAVGSDAEILNLAGPGDQVIDLQGRLVIPSMTDAHVHYYDYSLGRRRLYFANTPSLAELRQIVQEAVQAAEPGKWILGQGWNETRWPEKRMPTRQDLDEISPNNPVILWRNDLHLAVANREALRLAGVTSATPNPPEGIVDKDGAGEPTGILRDLGINLVSEIIPPPSEEETVEAMREGFAALHQLGLTGLHDYRVMGAPEAQSAFRAYQRLQYNGALHLRLWMHIPGERLQEAVALGLRSGMGDPYLRVGHVKLFSDGGQGARTAWMLEPYEDVNEVGIPLTPMDEIAEAVGIADRAGLAVAVHAIGDRANRELIGVFEKVLGGERNASTARPSAMHRIEHVQNIRPVDLQRLGKLNVAASIQPIQVTDDIPMVEQSVGKRGRYTYVYRDMLEAGIPLAFGSDCPVADPNPIWGIHAAVTRRGRDGEPQDGWYPQQCLSVSEAVWGFTMGPALVSGQQAHLGSLTPGKLADLVVLDKNIFEIDPMEIYTAKPVMTVFDGNIVYQTD